MRFQLGLAQLFVAVVAIAIAYGAYQYAMSRAIHTVIASQPKAQTYADPPTVDWTGCDFGLRTSRPSAASKPCRYEPNPWPQDEAHALPQISEADAKEATLWFASASFLPLVLGAAVAAIGFLMLRVHAARVESRRAYAELERMAGLGPGRDPFDRNAG